MATKYIRSKSSDIHIKARNSNSYKNLAIWAGKKAKKAKTKKSKKYWQDSQAEFIRKQAAVKRMGEKIRTSAGFSGSIKRHAKK